MFLKRLLVGVLMGVMIFSDMATCMPIGEDVNAYELTEYETLLALELIDEIHKPQEFVTREAFAGVVTRLMGKHTEEEAEKSYFYDFLKFYIILQN